MITERACMIDKGPEKAASNFAREFMARLKTEANLASSKRIAKLIQERKEKEKKKRKETEKKENKEPKKLKAPPKNKIKKPHFKC